MRNLLFSVVILITASLQLGCQKDVQFSEVAAASDASKSSDNNDDSDFTPPIELPGVPPVNPAPPSNGGNREPNNNEPGTPPVNPPVTKLPVYLCPQGESISGVDQSGKAICTAGGPQGLTPKWDGNWTANNFSCPSGYNVQGLHYDCQCSNNATWVACYKPKSQPGSHSHTDWNSFRCPAGTALKGFTENRQPICAKTYEIPMGLGLSPVWSGNWTANEFTCPYGTEKEMQHYECQGGCTNNANTYVCSHRMSHSNTVTLNVIVAQAPALFECSSGQYIVGWNENGLPVCDSLNTGVPIGFGLTPMWDGNWTGNRFGCPTGYTLGALHYDVRNSNNATWMACYKQ